LTPDQQRQADQQKAMSLHGKIFQNVLSTLAGGSQRPVRDQQGNPVTDASGNVQMAPASKKVLAGSILAGAISGLVASMSQPRQFTQLPGGRMIEDYSGGVKAGAQAAQPFTQAGAQTAAQTQANDQQTRAYATISHNLSFHAMSLANDKADREYQEGTVAEHQSMNDAMDQAYAEGNVQDDKGNPIQLYKAQNILGTEVQKMLINKQLGVTQDQVTPVGVIDVPNANGDGRTHPETLFSVYNPQAVIKMSDILRKDNPKLTNVPDGTPVPVRMLASWALNRANERGAVSSLTDHIDGYNAANPDAPIKGFDLKQAARTNPLIEKIYPYVTKYNGYPMDVMFDDIAKDPAVKDNQTLQAASAALQKAMGIKPEGLVNQAQDRAEALAQGKKNDAQKPADPARIQNAPALLKAKNTNLPAASLADYNSRLHPGMSNDELDKVMKDATAESEKIVTQQLAQDSHDQARAAKDEQRIAKGEKPVVGIDASGKQVLVPAGDVSKYGLSQVREVGQAENEKVTNARSLMTVFNNDDPDDKGLIQLATELNKEGKLGPAASRFQDWLNKTGSVPTSLAGFDAGDPDVQRLFTKLGLSTTGLMQVHVGARGSAAMLEHFAELANAKTMSGDTFLAALDAENKYVRMKAMLPQTKQAQSTQKRQNQTQQNQNQGGFNPNALPKAN